MVSLEEAFSCRWNRSTRALDLDGTLWYRYILNLINISWFQSWNQLAPLSVEIVEGTPNRPIQLPTKALATVSAVMSVIGMASGHRVNRSTQVSR